MNGWRKKERRNINRKNTKKKKQKAVWVFLLDSVFVIQVRNDLIINLYTFNHNDHQIHCIANVIKFFMINGCWCHTAHLHTFRLCNP